jgi:hypothetical protein
MLTALAVLTQFLCSDYLGSMCTILHDSAKNTKYSKGSKHIACGGEFSHSRQLEEDHHKSHQSFELASVMLVIRERDALSHSQLPSVRLKL